MQELEKQRRLIQEQRTKAIENRRNKAPLPPKIEECKWKLLSERSTAQIKKEFDELNKLKKLQIDAKRAEIRKNNEEKRSRISSMAAIYSKYHL